MAADANGGGLDLGIELPRVIPMVAMRDKLRRQRQRRRRVRYLRRIVGVESPQSTFAIVCVLVWYALTLTGVALNRELISQPGANGRTRPEILVLVQTAAAAILGAIFQSRPMRMKKESRIEPRDDVPTTNGSHRLLPAIALFSLLGLLRFVTSLLGVVILSGVPASFTETVKTLAPLFTVAAAYIVMGERTSLSMLVALVPIVIGFALHAGNELCSPSYGAVVAVCAIAADVLLNVICKMLLTKGLRGIRYDYLELQFLIALASFLVQLVVQMQTKEWVHTMHSAVRTGTLFDALDVNEVAEECWLYVLMAFSGLIYFTQSSLAFRVISHYSCVSFSILNSLKQAVLIRFVPHCFVGLAVVFPNCGALAAVGGGFLYSSVKFNVDDERMHQEARRAARCRGAHRYQTPDASDDEEAARRSSATITRSGMTRLLMHAVTKYG